MVQIHIINARADTCIHVDIIYSHSHVGTETCHFRLKRCFMIAENVPLQLVHVLLTV